MGLVVSGSLGVYLDNLGFYLGLVTLFGAVKLGCTNLCLWTNIKLLFICFTLKKKTNIKLYGLFE